MQFRLIFYNLFGKILVSEFFDSNIIIVYLSKYMLKLIPCIKQNVLA